MRISRFPLNVRTTGLACVCGSVVGILVAITLSSLCASEEVCLTLGYLIVGALTIILTIVIGGGGFGILRWAPGP